MLQMSLLKEVYIPLASPFFGVNIYFLWVRQNPLNVTYIIILFSGIYPLFICGYTQCCILVYMSFINHYHGFFTIIFLLFIFFFPWCICTCISSALKYESFSTNMRPDIPCFPSTTLARAIITLLLGIYFCYTLFCSIPISLHI